MITAEDFTAFGHWYSERHRRSKGRPLADATLKTRLGHVVTLGRMFGYYSPTVLCADGQRRETVDRWLDALAARMTPGALRSYVYTLIALGDWAQAKGYASSWAVMRSDIPAPNPLPAITVYSRDEMENIISAARGDSLRWWALVTFIADTGRRIGETLSLRWDWFRLHDQPAYVELPHNKSGRPEYVPLTRRLRDEVFTTQHIEKLAQEQRNGRRRFERDPLIFPFPWKPNSAMKKLSWFCEASGFEYRGWHAFRHSVITERLAAGVPVHAVAKLAGHSSTAVTERRYDHTTALSVARYVEPDWHAASTEMSSALNLTETRGRRVVKRE
jgi:integrase